MRARILTIVCMLLIATATMQAQSEATDMQEPVLSYLVCEWGLLTIEQPTEQPAIFIDIDAPADYSAVDTNFTISGTGAGLFEGNVIVEVSLQGGDVLFEKPTVLQAEELGAVGEWSIEVDLGEMDGATPIFVRAYSMSPEDGSTIAFDSLRLNANSEFGLPYVEIESPYFGEGVNVSPLVIEGMAGSAFENNIVIEVRDFESGDLLAETFATIQTDELAGSGPFSAEVALEAEPGTGIEVFAYHPPVADTDEIDVSDIEFVIVTPLAQTYDRFLTIQRDDPIVGAEDVCATTGAEFENENINPLVIDDVQVVSTMSMMPLVNVTIEAACSSNCAAPLRTRVVRDGDTFNIEIYYDTTQQVPCTTDLASITQRVSLGTLPNPDYTITVNGETIE